MSSDLMAPNLPLEVPPSASLPQRYEAARSALAECERVDECQQIADKAAAMAIYARQAEDQTLLDMAKRIHARAVRRCGELLAQIPRSCGGDRGNSATGPRRPVGETRTQVAVDAGLSERQRKTAVRVAAVPAESFESQVESSRPPSITQLAQQGTVSAPGPDKPPPSPSTRMEYETPTALEAFERFVRFCAQNEPASLARSSSAEDAVRLRQQVAKVDQWLARFSLFLDRR